MREFADVPEKINFSVDELCIAAACIGYDAVPCVKTKLTELKYESVQEIVERAILSLASKSAIELSVCKRPSVSENLGNIISIICTPESIIGINRSVLQMTDSLKVFLSGDKAVVIRNERDTFYFSDLNQFKTELTAAYDLTGTEHGSVSFSIMLSELKHARRLFDSFQADSADKYLASCVGEGKELIMEMFGAPKGFIIMKRWSKLNGGYENDCSDIILIRGKQLYRASCSSDDVVSVKGISPARFSERLNEYLHCKGAKK